MKKLSLLLLTLYAVNSSVFAQATPASMQHEGGETHVMYNRSDIKWVDGPPALPPGARVALMQGDPAKPGPFTIRATFPANYKVPPHWHPTMENVVVLQGTLYMGSGEKFDEASATALEAGGFSAIPARAPHYVFTKDVTELQIHGEGPFAITYFNSADDPRTAKSER